MLVLARYRNQRIEIGDDIVITVCRFAPGKVYLGVEAPPEMPVRRPDAKVHHRKADAIRRDQEHVE